MVFDLACGHGWLRPLPPKEHRLYPSSGVGGMLESGVREGALCGSHVTVEEAEQEDNVEGNGRVSNCNQLPPSVPLL